MIRPSKRAAPTEETPTLPLSPVELDAIVEGAALACAASREADSRLTVESFRIAMGSSSIDASEVEPLAPPGPPVLPGRAGAPPAEAPPDKPPAGSRGSRRIETRGPRRTRETLRADAIRIPPPPRKR